MQPQHREVHVENDEYERQQCPAKQIKRVVVSINDHILTFCAVKKSDHVLELFQRNTYALPFFSTFCISLNMLALFPGSCVPVMEMRARHTLRICIPS